MKVRRRCKIETYEVLSLMIGFGMFVIAILGFKDKDKDKDKDS